MFPDTLITSAHTLYTDTHTQIHTYKLSVSTRSSTPAHTHALSARGWNTSTAPVTLADVHGVTAAARP